MESLTKSEVLEHLKAYNGKRFTKYSLTQDLKKIKGDRYSITYRIVDKWLEVLLASNQIKSEYAGKIKLFWFEGEN